MSPPVIPVALCGGSGTRLCPLSRESYPMQFLPPLGEKSLLQQTMQRLDGGDGVDAAILVCHESSRFLACRFELDRVAESAVPMTCDTAPLGRPNAKVTAKSGDVLEARLSASNCPVPVEVSKGQK